MSKPYLEITYRQGKPLAAYLYLDRKAGDRSARSESHGDWVIDFAVDGRAIGVELLNVRAIDLASLNKVLAQASYEGLTPLDLAPLAAA